jgi:hypothetical protein
MFVKIRERKVYKKNGRLFYTTDRSSYIKKPLILMPVAISNQRSLGGS